MRVSHCSRSFRWLPSRAWRLMALGWVITRFRRGAASGGRRLEGLGGKPSAASPRVPRALPPASAGRAISFRDVGFHYPASDGAEPRWVLRHVSFDIPAGETLAVVGATGSGKSALMDLIPRVRDPQEGEILLDGVPLRELDLSALRREIGYVH